MSNFKIEFTLKQHTPIIHFQSEQEGATLRATELKPKFDKFLIEKVFKKNKVEYEKFLIDKNKDALDYKARIIAKPSTPTEIDSRDPLFFGNMGDGDKKKFIDSKEIKIEFMSFKIALIKIIKDSFESFLANTNFGTRQSKGFGSFYIKDKIFNKTLIPYKVYTFDSTNWKNDIKLFYQFLRQGINLPKGKEIFYSKPAIFTYMKNKNITWEKKAIKQHFFLNNLQNQQSRYTTKDNCVNFDSQNKYIVRDLFGLSTEQSWMSYGATIKKEHQDIKRFKSPITFKVVDNRVYFWANESVQKILNKRFNITNGRGTPLPLSTPPEFSFEEFFEYVKKIDLAMHIDKKFHSTQSFKTLDRIFGKLKNQ